MSAPKADPMISTAALAERLGAADLVVIDATWFMPDGLRDARAEHAEQHIPGAVFFDIDEISDDESALPHMLPSPAVFAAHARQMGVDPGSEIVVYVSPTASFRRLVCGGTLPRKWATARFRCSTAACRPGSPRAACSRPANARRAPRRVRGEAGRRPGARPRPLARVARRPTRATARCPQPLAHPGRGSGASAGLALGPYARGAEPAVRRSA